MTGIWQESLESWIAPPWIVVGIAACRQWGRERRHIWWVKRWWELVCPLQVTLKSCLCLCLSHDEGQQQQKPHLSHDFFQWCPCSTAASTGSERSLFCSHGTLELRDLVGKVQAGCSLIADCCWWYLSPAVKQRSLPASVGKVDSATCIHSSLGFSSLAS